MTVMAFFLFALLATIVVTWMYPTTRNIVVVEPAGVAQLPPTVEEGEGKLAKFDAWFDRMVYFSGTGMSATNVMLFSVLLALVVAAAVFLFVDHLLFAAMAALLTWGIALAVVMVMGQRRLRKFELQLPDAMRLLAKAVRAGESFDQGIQLVGESSSEPLATEFRRCGGQLEMGLPVAKAMRSLSNRVGSFDMQVFASTVAIHRQAGGRLSDTLDRLAGVIRERINYRRQMRSVTGAGRISAMVISFMAPIIFLYLFFFQPQYGQKLWSDPLGKMMIVVAFVSQALGVLWVKYILKSEY